MSAALWNLSLATGRVGIMRAVGSGRAIADSWLVAQSLVMQVAEARDKARVTACASSEGGNAIGNTET